MTLIKICGLTRLEDIAAVNEYRPDLIGFVFAASPRQVNQEQAMVLKAALDPNITAVGVFVNENPDRILDILRRGIIDMVQLHGNESAKYLALLKSHADCPVIKAVRVETAEQVLEAEQLPGDFLLLDSYHPGQLGGTGQTFDHTLIPVLSKHYFLAGGINPENIASILANTHPYGIDVSSGVETNRLKDPDKIRQVITAVRKANTREAAQP